MLLLRCLHPPGAATALAPVMASNTSSTIGFHFVLIPVGINVIIMLIMSLLINRWIMRREYPNNCSPKNIKSLDETSVPILQHISEDDLSYALDKSDTFVDVTPTEIKKLLFQVDKNYFKRSHKETTCADIMMRNVASVEYGTDVEDAWSIMYTQKLQAMPVIDQTHRVIGIVTWSNFLKFLNLTAYDSLQEKFRVFIRRSFDINTDKPEYIGHLMTKSVIVMPEEAHIIELIEPMSISGLRQIPIVNNDKRLVGMVYQSHLIAALYNQKMARV